MKNKLSIALTALLAVTLGGNNVLAADWSQASYADSDPNTVHVVSTDENSATFSNSATNTDICKLRITLDKVLKNRDDYAKVASVKWTVTYNGVSPDLKADALSGGTYLTNNGSVGYTIRCDEYDEENEKAIWNNTSYSVEDSYEVPEDTPLEKDGELVFMDWSYADIGNQGVSVTVSDLKFYDKDGKEIEQLGYKEWTEEMSADVVDSGSGNPTHTESSAETAETSATVDEDVQSDVPSDSEDEKLSETEAQETEVAVPIETAPATGDAGTYASIIALAGASVGLALTKKKRSDKS